jgi:hypothetical protein
MFTHWNHRVIKIQKDGEIYFVIAEVFYDDKNCPIAWAECKENSLTYCAYDDLKEAVNLIAMAFDYPVLIVEGEKLREE